MAEIIDFPPGGRPGRKWTQSEREALPIILVLPSVRVERWDGSLTPEEAAVLLAADKRRRRARRRRPPGAK